MSSASLAIIPFFRVPRAKIRLAIRAKPRSSVNNSTEDQKTNSLRLHEEGMTEDREEEITDFDSMDDAQRRRLLRRLREIPPARHKNESPYVPGSELDVAWRVAVDRVGGRFVSEHEKQQHLQPAIERLIDEAAIHRIDIGRVQAVSLIEGGRLTVNGIM